MRIAYFTESLLPHVDGVSLTLARLFESLERRGIDFRVFAPFDPGSAVSWGRRVHAVGYVRFPPYPEYRVSLPGSRAVARELERYRPALIHVVSPTPMAVWAQSRAARLGIPAVASFHTDFVAYFRYYRVRPLEPLGWRFLRWFHARCARTYVPSESKARELRARGIAGVELWSRGVDCTRFGARFRDPALRAAVGASADVPLLLLVSRLVREKDLDDLIGMERILRQRGARFRLALVGDGPMRRELEAALPGAFFAGRQAGEALARWFASADVFVFPSTTETFGNVVLEALASGLPAVVVDRGGPQDQIVPGETGFVARANDPADLAACVERLIADPALRARMGERAAREAASRDWEAVNTALIASYVRVAAACRAGTIQATGLPEVPDGCDSRSSSPSWTTIARGKIGATLAQCVRGRSSARHGTCCPGAEVATKGALRETMIWKLTPVDPDDPAWRSSSHRGPVIVRAPDERRAREEAQRAFGAATRFTPDTAFAVAVWRRPELVRAEIIRSSRYAPDGPTAILEPSFDTDLASQPPPRTNNRRKGSGP